MTNWKLIDNVIKIVTFFEESEHIIEDSNSIKRRVLNWYNHTDIADEELLAAAALEGDYDPALSYKDLLMLKEFYFPTESYEFTEIHIHEIEEALNDAVWQ